jgi:hypothetical protein
MKVDQISVFLENKPGALAEVTRILGDSGVNIRALSLADTKDFGILRLIVNDKEKAKEVLDRKGFTVRKTEVVAVEVPDLTLETPGLHGGVNALASLVRTDEQRAHHAAHHAGTPPDRPPAVAGQVGRP